MMRVATFVFITLCFSSAGYTCEFSKKESTPVFNEAKLIRQKAPKYPRSEASSGKEGWVVLSFVVSKDGEVVDPIIEDSSGNRKFERAAEKAVKRWKYSPALLSGKPTEQCKNQYKMVFALKNSESSASRAFVKRYKRIAKLIDEEKLSQASKEINELEKRGVKNLYEDAWLGWIKTQLSFKEDDMDKVYKNLLRAVAYEGVYLPKNIYFSALKDLFIYQVNSMNYSQALDTYKKLEEKADESSSIGSLRKYYQQVVELMKSEKPLFITGGIKQNQYWSYSLNRNEFSFSDIQGKIDKFEVRCDRKRQQFEYSKGNEWKIPKAWGACRLFVYGKKETKFKLVEYSS